jgi:hypothetical protein
MRQDRLERQKAEAARVTEHNKKLRAIEDSFRKRADLVIAANALL